MDKNLKTKVCSTCKRNLPLEMFRKRSCAPDGLMYQCKDCKNKIDKFYRQSDKGRQAAKKDRIRRRVLGIENTYEKQRRRNDVDFRLRSRLRTRLRLSLKKTIKSKFYHTLDLLGCSLEDLKKHLENQFVEGMSWDNYGEWHIDHIVPCASFDLSDPNQQRICFNFRNLQPLWDKDNQRKQDKLPENYLEIINNIKRELALC